MYLLPTFLLVKPTSLMEKMSALFSQDFKTTSEQNTRSITHKFDDITYSNWETDVVL